MELLRINQIWKINLTISIIKNFTLKRYSDLRRDYLENQAIEWNKKNDSTKYFGIYLNKNLTWKIYVKTLTQCYTKMKIHFLLVKYKSILRIKFSLMHQLSGR